VLNVADTLWWLFTKLKGYLQYSLVGAIGVVINFTALYLLTDKVHLWYLVSAMIAIILASTNNFILNYIWTFKDRKKNITNIYLGWFKFLLSIGLTEGLYLGLMYVFTSKMGLHYMLSAFLALCLTTVIRYVTAEKWIWGKGKSDKVNEQANTEKLESMINEKVYGSKIQ
jgi:putative flippase GtrA